MRSGFEWFVAWRYLRSKGSRVGRITMLAGLGIMLLAVGFYALKSHYEGIHPFQLTETQAVLRTVGLWGVISSLVLGAHVFSFGLFHSLMSIFTTISCYGVYIGAWALVIVLSVMNGFEVDLRRKILGSNAHLLVSKENGDISEWRELAKRLDRVCVKGNCVLAYTPYVTSEVVVAANSNYGTAIIKGIDPETAPRVTDLARNVSQGSLKNLAPIVPDAGPARPDAGHTDDQEPEDFSGGEDTEPRDFSVPTYAFSTDKTDPRVLGLDGILVGRELARNLHLFVGAEVLVVSPLGRDTPTGQVPRTRPFRVAGIFFSGMYEYDNKLVYVALPALQSFLSMGDEVNGIEIKVGNMDDTGPVVDTLKEILGPGYVVQDWKAINRSLFSALQIEKFAMFVILTIIILVASLSIVLNLIIIVVEKQREIAILKSMGASDGSVLQIFLFEGLTIGTMGTGVGLCVAVVTCFLLEKFGFPISTDVYYIDQLPVAMDPWLIVAVAVAGVTISVAATLYPSWIAARLRPVDGLRK